MLANRPKFQSCDTKTSQNLVNSARRKVERRGDYENLEANKNLTTSDYGTDSEPELENENSNRSTRGGKSRQLKFSPIPTVEFTDDDDNYFIYLQKQPTAKRKTEVYKNQPQKHKSLLPDLVEVPLTVNGVAPVPTIEFTDDDNYFIYLQKRETVKRKFCESDKSICKKRNSSNGDNSAIKDVIPKESSCVIICSDSEDEAPFKGEKKRDIAKKKEKCNKKAKTEKNVGVVTFEILDDDDGETNYMVYLQKEIETKKNNKIEEKEVIICSDSEDETPPKHGEEDLNFCEDLKSEEILIDVSSDSGKFKEDDSQFLLNEKEEENSKEMPSTPNTVTVDSEEINDPRHSSLSFIPIGNAISLCENPPEHFLIDPAIISEPNLVENAEIGGPLLGEKVPSLEDLNTFQECHLNESFLEELPDDTYLLESSKFEELESFLFNENGEKGYYFSNFSFDDESSSQPETFEADMQSLESLLNDSQLFSGDLSSSDSSTHNESVEIANFSQTSSLKKNCDRRRGKNFGAIYKQSRKIRR